MIRGTVSRKVIKSVHRSVSLQPCRARASAHSDQQCNIAVVGAGVIGLTTSLNLLKTFPNANVNINIIADVIADAQMTSCGAGGLWKPYTLGSTPAESVNRWGKATLDHYLDLYFSTEAPSSGVMLTSAYQLWKDPNTPDPEWATVVPHFRHLTPKELSIYDREAVHKTGWFYQTVITEGKLYLGWLMRQIRALGGEFHQHKVQSFDELQDFSAVVNCAGLGARELCDDKTIQGNRGQVLRVKAPWIRHYTNANGEAYIIPNTDTVVLGGTLGPGDEDTEPRESDRQKILEKCIAVVPSLAAAEIVGDWVGLRPSRPSVRLEVERLSHLGDLPVIHNYGHGGAGLTLGYGCALEATELVGRELDLL